MQDLAAQNRALVARVTALEAALQASREEVAALRAENAALRAENASLRVENARLLRLHGELALRVAELEKRLGESGGGGRGSPPPTRPRSGRKRGGQPGHKPNPRTAPAHSDATCEHPAPTCPRCGCAVEESSQTTERFTFEAVERALRKVQHILHEGRCPRCKRRVRAQVPRPLHDSDYDARSHATLAALRASVGATVGDMETFTRTVWQWPMSGGQIVAMLDRTAAALVQTYWWLVEQVKVAPAVYHDTTSWWVDGQRAVFWVFTTRRVTVYWIDPSGAGTVPLAVLGPHIDGKEISDSAERMQLVEHAGTQRCLAHPLRTARDLVALYPDDEEVTAMMIPLQDQLRWIIGLHTRRDALAPSTWIHYRARARRELLELARQRVWKQPDCGRMAKRIERDVDLWVMFLWDETGEVEPTDNRSERALRPAVIDRKRMQQNRTLRGVYRDVILRSVAASCRQLGVDFLAAVEERLLARTAGGPAPGPSPLLREAMAHATAPTTPQAEEARAPPTA